MNYLVGEKIHIRWEPMPQTGMSAEVAVFFWTFWKDGECVEVVVQTSGGSSGSTSRPAAQECMKEYEARYGAPVRCSYEVVDVTAVNPQALMGLWEHGFESPNCPYHLFFSPEEIVDELEEIVRCLG